MAVVVRLLCEGEEGGEKGARKQKEEGRKEKRKEAGFSFPVFVALKKIAVSFFLYT